MDTNIQKAIKEERLKITHALMAAGYYPYTIKLDGANSGGIEIIGRRACYGDETLIAEEAQELSGLNGKSSQ